MLAKWRAAFYYGVMFGLVKNLLKDKTPELDAVKLADLHVGCMIGFGFVPQKNISGKRVQVTAANSYLFDADSFVAYRLEDDYVDVNLIIAEGETAAGSYLALSQRVEERLFSALFVSPLPAGWFALKEGDAIDVAAFVLGAPQGWFAPHYKMAMKTRGRLLDGDYRLRKPSERASLSRPFEYVLLVDESHSHALEAEKYENGEIRVFATVYRSSTDIGEITRIARAELPVLLSDIPSPSIEPMQFFPERISPDVKPEEEVVAEAPVHGKVGRLPIAPALSAPQLSETLACDTRLAGKMIDEAQRNGMPLSELIRKVIDLPARIEEQVLIPFSLTPAEVAELARRYELSATDYDAVKEKIIDDLQNFVGGKR